VILDSAARAVGRSGRLEWTRCTAAETAVLLHTRKFRTARRRLAAWRGSLAAGRLELAVLCPPRAGCPQPPLPGKISTSWRMVVRAPWSCKGQCTAVKGERDTPGRLAIPPLEDYWKGPWRRCIAGGLCGSMFWVGGAQGLRFWARSVRATGSPWSEAQVRQVAKATLPCDGDRDGCYRQLRADGGPVCCTTGHPPAPQTLPWDFMLHFSSSPGRLRTGGTSLSPLRACNQTPSTPCLWDTVDTSVPLGGSPCRAPSPAAAAVDAAVTLMATRQGWPTFPYFFLRRTPAALSEPRRPAQGPRMHADQEFSKTGRPPYTTRRHSGRR